MQHGQIVRGQLLRRYKRFLADVVVGDGSNLADRGSPVASITVHCPNTGPMVGLLDRYSTAPDSAAGRMQRSKMVYF